MKLKFVAATAILCVMAGCCPERKTVQNFESCITACNIRQDAIIATHRHCLAVADEIRYNALLGTPGHQGCFELSGEARANCIQMANRIYQENVRECDEAFDRDLKESRQCALRCNGIAPKDPLPTK